MTLFSRRQSTLSFCITLGIFLLSGALALLLPVDAAVIPEESSSSAESAQPEEPSPVFTATDTDLYNSLEIGLDVSSGTVGEVPYVQVTARNNSTEHAFLGTVSFHTDTEEDVLPPIELNMLPPGCSVTCFLSGFVPEFEDFASRTVGNYYDYTAGSYPPPCTLIYIDGALCGVQMNENNLNENEVVHTTGYLMMDENGELPISGSVQYVSQIALDLDGDQLILDPGSIRWTGQIDLGIPVATEIRLVEEDASAAEGEDDAASEEEIDASGEDADA